MRARCRAVVLFLAFSIAWRLAFSVEVAPGLSLGGPCPEIDASLFNGKEEALLYRCALIDQLKARGLVLARPVGQQILAELLRPYDTVIQLHGKAALPTPAVIYLFDEFAHTAQLINFYNNSNYQVIYTQSDRSQFFATNNRNMQATVDVIDETESVASKNYVLFENGQAKLMFWRFTGKSVIELGFVEQDNQTAYEVKIHLFSTSAVFHAFFESPLFAYLIRAMFKKIVRDIVAATQQFGKSKEVPPTVDPDFAAALLERLQ